MEYPDLGMEAVWKVEVENFPAFVVVDHKGRTSSPRPPRRPCT
jgi:fumarate hydratase class I